MNRRLWPIAIAVLALVVLGSYLAYTQYLVTEIRAQNENSTRIYALVQEGLLSQDPYAMLLDIQGELVKLDLPMVFLDSVGEPTLAVNLPFEPDLTTPEGRTRVRNHAERLARQNPRVPVVTPTASVYFGEPPYMAWLRWVPWLQVMAGVILVLVAYAVVRADLRAERERLWAAMARELAHQMGTPLTSLAGWIEVLALPESEREAWATSGHIAGVIHADVERLERVSRRFELIGKPPSLEPVRVRDVLLEVQSYFAPRLPRMGRGIRIRTHVARGIPALQANHVLLVWAVENVVKNAVDALAGRGGRILVLAHADQGGGGVHIHIADDGPGIPPQVSARIFEPGVSTKTGGWGVGLSLTRRIIEQLHGGRVSVRARRRRGTVFDVSLPVSGRPRRRLRPSGWNRVLPSTG